MQSIGIYMEMKAFDIVYNIKSNQKLKLKRRLAHREKIVHNKNGLVYNYHERLYCILSMRGKTQVYPFLSIVP